MFLRIFNYSAASIGMLRETESVKGLRSIYTERHRQKNARYFSEKKMPEIPIVLNICWKS